MSKEFLRLSALESDTSPPGPALLGRELSSGQPSWVGELSSGQPSKFMVHILDIPAHPELSALCAKRISAGSHSEETVFWNVLPFQLRKRRNLGLFGIKPALWEKKGRITLCMYKIL